MFSGVICPLYLLPVPLETWKNLSESLYISLGEIFGLAACVENGFTGGEIWIHDLVENRSTKLGSDDTAFIHSLAFSTDSLGLISASSGGLRYWNVGGSEQVSELPSFDSKSVAFCPDGKLICVGRVNDIKFWNAETLRELLSIPWSTGHLVAGAYIDPTSRYLIGFQGRVEKEFTEMTLRVWATGEGRNHEVGPKP
jgi:hypothetical protein